MPRIRRKDTWLQKHWRPCIGFAYIAVIIFDFIFFPIITGFNWTPLTLGNAGVFHVSMGGVLGVTAWTRGQEKLNTVEEPRPAATEEYVVDTEASSNVQVHNESTIR